MYVHKAGYAPSHPQSQYCTISRRRFRLRPLAGANDARPCDPSLSLVIYAQAAPRDQIPVARVRPDQYTQGLWNQRVHLVQRGQLARRDFMLNDRPSYPMIQDPTASGTGGRPAPRYAGGAANYARAAMPTDYVSNSKRQRNNPRGGRTATGRDAGATNDEEHGDLVEGLTARDVSQQRFMQHHEWMEEVFASPYATSKITPVALGLGLKGDLEQLTRGFFNAPDPQPPSLKKENKKGKEGTKSREHPTYGVEAVTSIGPARIDEFAERVNAKLAAINDEMDEMKRMHAQRLGKLAGNAAKWREAEKRLRSVPHETRAASAGSVDDIVREAEASVQSRIKELPSLRCVRAGGLEEKAPSPAQHSENDVSMGGTDADATAPTSVQPTDATARLTTPSSDTPKNATPSTSAARPNEATAVPATAVPAAADVLKMEQDAAEADDWVVVDKQEPKSGDPNAASTPDAGDLDAPVDAPANDLGADIIDFGADDASDAVMDGDDFAGGAFEEAIELTTSGGLGDNGAMGVDDATMDAGDTSTGLPAADATGATPLPESASLGDDDPLAGLDENMGGLESVPVQASEGPLALGEPGQQQEHQSTGTDAVPGLADSGSGGSGRSSNLEALDNAPTAP